MSAATLPLPKMWDLNLIPDLQGKVAIVTGANAEASIGWHTAHELAKKGARVFVHARSLEKAQAGVDAILMNSPSIPKENLGTFVAELSDLKAVKAAAEKFLEERDRLDILVNNASLLARELDKDSNGISVSMLTNHLAPFVLTTSLLPLLKKTSESGADVRIVIVSSTTHALVPHAVRFRDLDDFNISFGQENGMPANIQRYGKLYPLHLSNIQRLTGLLGLSKLANLLFAKELQRKLDAEQSNIISIPLHPGDVHTPGATRFVHGEQGKNFLKGLGTTPEEVLTVALTPLQGAITSLFAATAPEVRQAKEKYAGNYLMPFGVPEGESEYAKDAKLAAELWETSEKIVDAVLAK